MSRLLIVVAAFLGSSPVAAQELVLTNGHIVDPETQTVVQEDLWIRDGRIVGRGDAPEQLAGQRIDLEGRWVIPGLVDLHTHSFGSAAPGGVTDGAGTADTAERVVRTGVTAFLDLFGAEDYILGLRERQRAGDLGGAEILAAGPCFTATDGHCSEYGIPTRLIDSPEDARREVAELAPKRPDVVKVVYDHAEYGATAMPSIDRATLEALVAAADGAGIRTVVHVGTWEDARHAAVAGAAAVTHVPRGPLPDDLPDLMVEHGTYHIPTLVVHTDLITILEDPGILEHALAEAVTSEQLRAAYTVGLEGLDDRSRSWALLQREHVQERLDAVGALYDAGVPMLVGTDAGNWGVIQGFSVHREMQRLAQAGLSPWDALAAATTSPGAFLGRELGVQEGDEADLVVLDASPVDEIANTRRIAFVILDGEAVRW